MELSSLIASQVAGLLGQITLLAYVTSAKISTRFLRPLIILFFVTNCVSLATIIVDQSHPLILEVTGRIFYAVYALLNACFLSYAINACSIKVNDFFHRFEEQVWLFAFFIVILALVTDEIIKGQRPFFNTITVDQGKNYWLVFVQGFFAAFAAIAVLINEWVNQRYELQKKRCLFILCGYLLCTLSVGAVTLLFRHKFNVNVIIVFPFMSIFTLCLVIYGESKYRKIISMNVVPGQIETVGYDELINIFTQYREEAYSFNQATEKIDYLLLSYTYDKHKGNITKMAKSMDIGRSTLYRKMQKYNLK